MKNKAIITTGFVALATVIGAGFAFNQSMQSLTQDGTGRGKNQMMSQKVGKGVNQPNQFMQKGVLSFFGDLTDEKKEELKNLLESHRKESIELTNSFKGEDGKITDQEGFKTAIESLRQEHLNSLKQYVSGDKLEEFEEFVENQKNLDGKGMQSMKGRHKGNSNRMGMGKGMGIQRFFGDLTDEQKEELNKIMQDHMTQINDLKLKHFEELKKYVSEENLEEYEEFIANHQNFRNKFFIQE